MSSVDLTGKSIDIRALTGQTGTQQSTTDQSLMLRLRGMGMLTTGETVLQFSGDKRGSMLSIAMQVFQDQSIVQSTNSPLSSLSHIVGLSQDELIGDPEIVKGLGIINRARGMIQLEASSSQSMVLSSKKSPCDESFKSENIALLKSVFRQMPMDVQDFLKQEHQSNPRLFSLFTTLNPDIFSGILLGAISIDSSSTIPYMREGFRDISQFFPSISKGTSSETQDLALMGSNPSLRLVGRVNTLIESDPTGELNRLISLCRGNSDLLSVVVNILQPGVFANNAGDISPRLISDMLGKPLVINPGLPSEHVILPQGSEMAIRHNAEMSEFREGGSQAKREDESLEHFESRKRVVELRQHLERREYAFGNGIFLRRTTGPDHYERYNAGEDGRLTVKGNIGGGDCLYHAVAGKNLSLGNVKEFRLNVARHFLSQVLQGNPDYQAYVVPEYAPLQESSSISRRSIAFTGKIDVSEKAPVRSLLDSDKPTIASLGAKFETLAKTYPKLSTFLTTPPAEYFGKLGINDTKVQEYLVMQFVDNIDTVIALMEGKGAKVPVIYPTSARGDCNAYKYTAYLDKNRPFTMVSFQDGLKDLKGLALNANMGSFIAHFESEPGMQRKDFIFLPQSFLDSPDGDCVRAIINETENPIVDYDKYDEVVYHPEIRGLAQDVLSRTSGRPHVFGRASKYMVELKDKFPDANNLVIINVNGRSYDTYDARNERHSLDPMILNAMIDYARENGCAVMLVGDDHGALDGMPKELAGEISKKCVVATRLWSPDGEFQGLDRHEQRAMQYAITTQFQSSLYFGMQSGVNEDAVLLHNTNVFSICEDVGKGQVGFGRVYEKMSSFSGKGAYNNFLALQRTEFLTKTGQLASFQLQSNPLAYHKHNTDHILGVFERYKEQMDILGGLQESHTEDFSRLTLHRSWSTQSLDGLLEEEVDIDDAIYITETGQRLDEETVSRLEPDQLEKFKLLKPSPGDESGTLFVSKNGTRYLKIEGEPVRYLKHRQDEDLLPESVDLEDKDYLRNIIDFNSPKGQRDRQLVVKGILGSLIDSTRVVKGPSLFSLLKMQADGLKEVETRERVDFSSIGISRIGLDDRWKIQDKLDRIDELEREIQQKGGSNPSFSIHESFQFFHMGFKVPLEFDRLMEMFDRKISDLTRQSENLDDHDFDLSSFF